MRVVPGRHHSHLGHGAAWRVGEPISLERKILAGEGVEGDHPPHDVLLEVRQIPVVEVEIFRGFGPAVAASSLGPTLAEPVGAPEEVHVAPDLPAGRQGREVLRPAEDPGHLDRGWGRERMPELVRDRLQLVTNTPADQARRVPREAAAGPEVGPGEGGRDAARDHRLEPGGGRVEVELARAAVEDPGVGVLLASGEVPGRLVRIPGGRDGMTLRISSAEAVPLMMRNGQGVVREPGPREGVVQTSTEGVPEVAGRPDRISERLEERGDPVEEAERPLHHLGRAPSPVRGYQFAGEVLRDSIAIDGPPERAGLPREHGVYRPGPLPGQCLMGLDESTFDRLARRRVGLPRLESDLLEDLGDGHRVRGEAYSAGRA